MRAPYVFLRFVAKAALNYVGFGVAGDFAVEVLPQIAAEVWERWGKGKPEQELKQEIQAVAALDDADAGRLAAQAVAEEGGSPVEPRLAAAVSAYVARVPSAVRASQRRPADPTGKTVSPALVLQREASLVPLLPHGVPRFAPGQRVPGFADWTLEALLGVGGFGEVWKAVNPPMPPVAVKFCLDAAAVETLRNEKHLLGRVRSEGTHPGIVRLENTSLMGETPCLMYEYVSGGDLAKLIAEWHATRIVDLHRNVARLMKRLADVVAFAHKLRPPIVHRDLKPANVLVEQGKQGGVVLRVADFGIGGVANDQAVAKTRLGTSRGGFLATALRGSHTPLYASAEQMRGDDPSPADDVHALGVIWYQALTGDLTAGPSGQWWRDLEDAGVPHDHVELLGACIDSLKRRLPNAVVLDERLDKLLAAKAVPPVVVQKPVPPPPLAIPVAQVAEPDHDDWVAALLASKTTHRNVVAEARTQHERHEDARCVELLMSLPEDARDRTLLAEATAKRDKLDRLKAKIQADGKAGRVQWLSLDVEEYLELKPNDEAMKRLLSGLDRVPRRVQNGIGMTLVLVRPGKFQMGSPDSEPNRNANEKLHEVALTQAFYVAIHPVTQEQYRRAMNASPSYFASTGGGKGSVQGLDTKNFPVEQVSWHDAVAFCQKLSEMPEEKKHGRLYRLPTEAEWEYSCREGGVSKTPFHFGSKLSAGQANFDAAHPYNGGTAGAGLGRTSAVGTYPANALGLCDMHGNVWEWCQDWHDDGYYNNSPVNNPAGPPSGASRVLRGGSWSGHGGSCRAARRNGNDPGYRSYSLGFRVVLCASQDLGIS